MKAFGVLVLICIAAFFLPAASANETCERIENDEWGFGIGHLKTCNMQATAINSKNFSITSDRDATVEGFYAYENKKLEYLPNNLGAKFPNLFVLNAGSCSIKKVKKENFKGLGMLRYLCLYYNQIEKIDDDTFEYIPAVEWIVLYDNKIKKFNGVAFASLHKLTKVDLNSNECINEGFDTAARIAELPRIVTEKCGFVAECNIETCLSEKAKLEEELSSLKSKNERLEIEKTQIESLHNECKTQLLLASVAAFVAVAILLGIIVPLIK